MTMLERYVSQFKTLECAESFHAFSWLAAVAMCMGRRCWVSRGFFTTYPNIYVVLVGEAGCGKSVAIFQARDLIEDLNKQLSKEERIVIAPKCSSARKLMEILAAQQVRFKHNDVNHTHAPIACFLSELSNFIQLDPNFTINFLTDSYDDKYFDYETQHKGGCHIEGPAPVILGCTTHEYITSKLREDVITGGMSRRIHWIMDERSKVRNANPQKPPMDQGLIDCLKRVRKMVGQFEWEPYGFEIYKHWYDTTERKNFGINGYGDTKNVKIEKMAMLLAASERGELMIRSEDVNEAMRLCGVMEQNLEKVFEGIGRNQLNASAAAILVTLDRQGGRMSESAMRVLMYRQVNTKEFDEVVGHLIKSEKLRRENGVLVLVTGPDEDADQSPSASRSVVAPTVETQGSADVTPSQQANRPHPRATHLPSDHPPAGNGSQQHEEMR